MSAIHPWQPANAVYLLRSKITLLAQYLLEPFPIQGFVRSLVVLSGILTLVSFWAQKSERQTRNTIVFALVWTAATLLPYLGWRAFQPWYVYLAIIGTTMLGVRAAVELSTRLPSRVWRRRAAATAFVVWLGASVYGLQANNEQERQAGAATLAVVQALATAVPSPAPRTLIVVSGLESLRFGADPWAGKAILIFGLPDAARLWLGDPALDVTFGDRPSVANDDRPVVFLRWDEKSKRFAATAQALHDLSGQSGETNGD